MRTRKRQRGSRWLLVGALLLVPVHGWAVNCCKVNGGTCNIIPPLTHGQTGWMGSICGTTLEGTNCTAKLDTDASASSGDCITLGMGVTLDLDGHAIDCTGSCGSAVLNTNSGGSSNAVTITNGDITGAWTTGINVTNGTNSSVSEILVDGAYIGISKVRGKIDHTVVRNSSYIGIDLNAGDDLESVVLRNNGNTAYQGYGLKLSSTVSSSNFDNVLFIGNYANVWHSNASGKPQVQRSEVQDAVTCDCFISNFLFSACAASATSCLDFTNATTPNIVGDTFLP